MSGITPIQRRLLAEDLVRVRRADEQRRYAACQRQGRIDPNPHQIDAVVFALRRIPEGGCILADEVGLGKTIEAGLIISQLMAEGKRRVLLVVPKALVGQWQTEMYTLFGIETREGRLDPDAFVGDGVFLVHRELAGGLKGASLLKASDPFDLIVVDEAHEIFSAVYKRYGKDGQYDEQSKHAQTAGRFREVVKRGGSPVILLTATPIQNSLAELWGLVQYVEPSGTLLGRLPTFRDVFCEDGDRAVQPAQAPELKRRLQTVLQRTLRRQAQEFLEVPFVERRSRVFEYPMSDEERALYEDVTTWLMREDLSAFRGKQRHLLLIGFHRRMASSLAALAVSLHRVADRLRVGLTKRGYSASEDGARLLHEIESDFEGNLEPDRRDELDEEGPEQPVVEEAAPIPEAIERTRAELKLVEEFAARASALKNDSKARRFLDALQIIRERGERGTGAGKAVVFTESLTTQDYLRSLLIENGVAPEKVTLFRGDNETPEAARALARWEDEVGKSIPAIHRPSREVALRLALVHEFATRSEVFISTEAGAKGLNLQFCDTVINYDLPWNPQRIEQRIGRVHRYGQRRGVTVISFLAEGNEAQRLTLEILTQKLDLFGKVLDASDAVLYEPSHAAPESLVASVSVDFEKELRSIYSRARSVEDVTEDLLHLRSTMEERRQAFDLEQERASGIVETRLDNAVRQVFVKYQSTLPSELEGLDRDVDTITRSYFDSVGISYSRAELPRKVVYEVGPSAGLPQGYRDGFSGVIGDSRDLPGTESLHVGHPIVQAAIEDARKTTEGAFEAVFALPDALGAPELANLAGRRGHLVVSKVSYRGIEPVDSLIATARVEGDREPLEPAIVESLLAMPIIGTSAAIANGKVDELEDAVAEAVVLDQSMVAKREQTRFEQMLRQLDHYLADQVLVMRRKKASVEDRLEQMEKQRPKVLNSQDLAALDAKMDRLAKVRDDIDGQIERLETEGDAEYNTWREGLYARRFRKPEVSRVLELEFQVVAES